MKKVYLLASVLMISGVAVSQNTDYETVAKNSKSELATEMVANRAQSTNFDRAAGDIIWVDSFEVNTNWVAAGPSFDYESNGWSIGSTTTGWYFPNTGAMGTSGTFARFTNGVASSADAIAGPFTFEYVGGPNSGAIDLTGIPAPHLEFEQYGARFRTVQAVEISTNGTDWYKAMTNADIPPLTDVGGSIFGQPETRRFYLQPALDSAAGSLTNVHVRLYWSGDQNGTTFNNVEYGWFVDNIRIVEGNDYEAALINPKYRWGVAGDVFTDGLDYHLIPFSQISPMEFSAEISNSGAMIGTGSNVSVDVTGAGTYSGVSPNSDILQNSKDSFVVAPQFTPTTVGTYNISMTANQTNTDADLSDNTFTTSFEITEGRYARDNGVQTGGIRNVTSNPGGSLSVGNMMEVFADATVIAMDIVITDDDMNVGQFIYGTIYRFDASASNYVEVAVTEEYEIQQSDLNGTPITLNMFEFNPLEVFAGDDLLVMAAHFGGTDGEEVQFATAQEVQEQTVRGVVAAGTFFNLLSPNAVMVRLVMPEPSSIDEAGAFSNISVGQNVPNPFTENTLITYSLNEAANVTLDILDVTGKVVSTINEGTQGAGEHNITINAGDLSDGVYFYNFKAGNYSVTKRMVVNK